MSTKKKLIESTMFTRRGIYSNIDYTQDLCRLRWTLDLYILKNNTPVTKELLEKNGFQWGLTSDEQDQEALMNMSFEKGYVYDDAEIEIKFQKCGNELSFSKRFAAFSENTDEPIREVKKQSITIQIDKSVYEKAVSDMNVLVGDVADYEACHQEADKILMKFLESIGCNELVETFDAVGKWYS